MDSRFCPVTVVLQTKCKQLYLSIVFVLRSTEYLFIVCLSHQGDLANVILIK